MTREQGAKKRKEAELARFGSVEARSEHYRNLQKKSRQNYKGTGGFKWLKANDPAKLKLIQRQGGKSGGKRPSN